MKLPNGFGTVYKLSGNRRKPWIARLTVGWTTVVDKKTGKEKQKQLFETVGYFEEKKEALNALVTYKTNPVSPNADITLGELYAEWSELKYKEKISIKTINGYKASWKRLQKHEKVVFKDLRISHWQSIINDCYTANLSFSTINNIKLVVGQLYDYAKDNGIVDNNLGKKIKVSRGEKTTRDAFTDIEIKAIKEAARKGIEWFDTILILIYTGMRISELLLLTKFSINLKEKTITGGIKTDAGKDRVIPIHPLIYPYIEKWYNRGGERLICNSEGKAMSDRLYREKCYRPALESINVRILDPHCCRHTFATLLSKAGANTKSIQKLIGHSSYSTTADIYTHTDINELKKAINKL